MRCEFDVYGILLYLIYSLVDHGYRMFIYERFLNPLSKLPGPKVLFVLAVLTVGTLVLGRGPQPSKCGAWSASSWLSAKFGTKIGMVSFTFLFHAYRLMPTSSSAIEHILNDPTIYPRPKFEQDTLTKYLGKGLGLLTAVGKRHRRQKKALAPAFSPRHLRGIAEYVWWSLQY